jgi:hypothetical protein
MTITRDKYKDVLKRLCDKASKNGSSPELYNEIYEDLDKITDALIVFSKFFDNFVKIAIDDKLTHNDKVNKITKLSFNNHHLTKKQAIDILERIKKSEKDAMITLKDVDMEGGGKYDILPYFKDENNTDYTFRGVNTRYPSTTKEVNTTGSRLGRIFSYYFFRLPLLYALKFIYSLGGAPFKGFKVKDFDSSVPLIYYVLFIIGLVPIPVIGSIAGIFTDIYTFIRAIDDGRIYLALITFISGILSLFILRAFDLGALFKLFYFMDVKHEVDYKNKDDRQNRRSAMADMLNITPTEEPKDIVGYAMNDITKNLEETKEQLEENLYNVYEEKNEVEVELEKLDSDAKYENIAEELITKMGEPVDKKSSKFKEYVKEIKRRLFGKKGFLGIFGKKGGSTNNLNDTIDKSPKNQEGTNDKSQVNQEEITDKSHENQEGTNDKSQENHTEITDKSLENKEETTDNSEENQAEIADKLPENKEEMTHKSPENQAEIAYKLPENQEEMTNKLPENQAEIADKLPENKAEMTDKSLENQAEIADKLPENKKEMTDKSPENQAEIADKLPENQEETTDNSAENQEEITDKSQENKEETIEQIDIDENILDQLIKENDEKKTELTEKLKNINTKLDDLENKIEQIENIDKNEIKRQAEELVSEAELKALRGNITDDKIDNAVNNLIKDNKKETENNIEKDIDNIEIDEKEIDTNETNETNETETDTNETNEKDVEEVKEDNKIGGKRRLLYKRRKSSKKSKKKSKKKSSKKSKR